VEQEKIDLALAFLQSQPGAAAAILERQPLEQVAEFLAGLPHTYGALLLTRMLPQYTARLFRQLDAGVAAGMLSQLDTSLVAAIMRQCHRDLSRQLLDLLPDRSRLATRLLLNYAEDAVGAWMNARVSTLPEECSVGEALERIRQDHQVADTGASLVVSRERDLRGSVSHAELLRAPEKTAITAVMVTGGESISARTPLKSALDNPLWFERDSIPVTNRNHKLVGVLRHLDLRSGLTQTSASILQPQGADPVSGLFEAYAGSLLVIFVTLGDLVRGKTGRGR